MEKEISSGAMLGIVLIALAAIIALGFGVFSIAKGTANEGTVAVQSTLASAEKSVFEDYNQKVVTGTQVMSAYDTFKGKPVAILLTTTHYLDVGQNSGYHADHVNPARVHVHETATNSNGWASGGRKMINYNALLINADKGGGVEPTNPQNKPLEFKNGVYYALGFQTDEKANVIYDNITSGFTKTGNVEYVAPNGRFDSYLIKDKSGVIIGIAFTQLAEVG